MFKSFPFLAFKNLINDLGPGSKMTFVQGGRSSMRYEADPILRL